MRYRVKFLRRAQELAALPIDTCALRLTVTITNFAYVGYGIRYVRDFDGRNMRRHRPAIREGVRRPAPTKNASLAMPLSTFWQQVSLN